MRKDRKRERDTNPNPDKKKLSDDDLGKVTGGEGGRTGGGGNI